MWFLPSLVFFELKCQVWNILEKKQRKNGNLKMLVCQKCFVRNNYKKREEPFSAIFSIIYAFEPNQQLISIAWCLLSMKNTFLIRRSAKFQVLVRSHIRGVEKRPFQPFHGVYIWVHKFWSIENSYWVPNCFIMHNIYWAYKLIQKIPTFS